MCLAPKAQQPSSALGSAPGFNVSPDTSAESAIHSCAIEARFQRCLCDDLNSWGDAPGYHEIAPLALNRIQPRALMKVEKK